MKSKSLVKKMSVVQANIYCEGHTDWSIPTSLEAEQLDDYDHPEFLISSKLDGRTMLYHKIKQTFRVSHPAFLNNIVLVKRSTQ